MGRFLCRLVPARILGDSVIGEMDETVLDGGCLRICRNCCRMCRLYVMGFPPFNQRLCSRVFGISPKYLQTASSKLGPHEDW